MKADDRARKIVVIPDAHAHPGYDNARFSWLGALIERERPSHVVCLGDFADMAALCSYDRGKRGFEGRRYVHDVESARDALELLHREVRSVAPRWLMCLGNHEARIDKATSDAAELDGAIGVHDLGFSERGWQCVPYQGVLELGGFAFSHHFASGVAGRPIGGMNQAASMNRLLHKSSVAGHSHVYDMAIQTRPDRSRVMSIVAGCYVHLDHSEGWSSATEHMWVNGVTILEGVEHGWAQSWRFVSQLQMRDEYRAVQSEIVTEPPPVGPIASTGAPANIEYTGEERTDSVVIPWPSIAAMAREYGVDESTPRKWSAFHSRPWWEWPVGRGRM